MMIQCLKLSAIFVKDEMGSESKEKNVSYISFLSSEGPNALSSNLFCWDIILTVHHHTPCTCNFHAWERMAATLSLGGMVSYHTSMLTELFAIKSGRNGTTWIEPQYNCMQIYVLQLKSIIFPGSLQERRPTNLARCLKMPAGSSSPRVKCHRSEHS